MSNTRFAVFQVTAALLLALVCIWGATQWAASMLGYQAALGAPLLSIAGIAIYAPWKVFAWWLTFDRQAPGVFARAGAVAALGGRSERRRRDWGSRLAVSSQTYHNNLWLGPLGGFFRYQDRRPAGRSRHRARPL